MLVEELKNSTEWETFLKASPKGTFFHSIKWKEVIEKSFSYPAIYLVVRDMNGAVVGVCPGFVLKSGPLKAYVSMPHSDYGGFVIDKSYIQKASLSLRIFIKRFCSDRGIAYAKINFTDDRMGRFFKSPLSYVDTSTGTMEIDLKATPSDFIWDKVFSRKQRYEIRRFERDGFSVREANTKSDLREFYSLYLSNMRHLGVFGYPYDFFQNIWSILFPENFNIMLLEKGKCVGGLAQFKYGQGIYGGYVAIDRKWEWGRYSMMPYIIWKLIRLAEENVFRYISLGSTPSNTRHIYYNQKSSFGSTFLQQERILIPFSCNAKIFVLAGAKAIQSWRIARKNLPLSLSGLLERKFISFFRQFT